MNNTVRFYYLLFNIMLFLFSARMALAITIHDIENSFNRIKSMHAEFEQDGPEPGIEYKGYFYLTKPGKIRWEYSAPRKITIIVKTDALTYYDHELEEITHTKTDNIVLKLLTAPEMHFDNYADQVKLIQHPKEAEVVLTLKPKFVQDALASQLVLLFDNINQPQLNKIFIINQDYSIIKLTIKNVQYNINILDTMFTLKNPTFFRLQE